MSYHGTTDLAWHGLVLNPCCYWYFTKLKMMVFTTPAVFWASAQRINIHCDCFFCHIICLSETLKEDLCLTRDRPAEQRWESKEGLNFSHRTSFSFCYATTPVISHVNTIMLPLRVSLENLCHYPHIKAIILSRVWLLGTARNPFGFPTRLDNTLYKPLFS